MRKVLPGPVADTVHQDQVLASEVVPLRLPGLVHRLPVDVDSEGSLRSGGGETDRGPDLWQPGREVVQQGAALLEGAKHGSVFPGADLVLATSSAAGVELLTGQGHVAAQHEVPGVLDGDDVLIALFVRVCRELVSLQSQTYREL